MTSYGTVSFKKIKAMLKHCAAGHEIKKTTHHHWITYKDKTYRSFPRGPHGNKDFGVEKGECKKMIKHLKISPECVRKYLPGIQIKRNTPNA